MTFTFLGLLGMGLSLTLTGCPADGDEADTMVEGETTNGDGDGDSGDGDGDTQGDGDGDPTGGECFNQPPECARFVECIGAVVPSQLEAVEAMFGADGSCWCGTEDEAQACYDTCVEEVADALVSNPTVQQCHETYCNLDELDATQPYGPIVNGACTPYTSEQGDMIEQTPIMNPAGEAGGFCSPKCSGLADYCPESSQTSAQGICGLNVGGESHCMAYCWVDSEVVGGTQCMCGATCQPNGGPDGEGNLRGICTFP